MEEVLRHINGVPGVIGSLICDESGRMAVHAFPPLFDQETLRKASSVVAEIVSRGKASGPADLFDLRYAEGRIVARPLQGASLMLLCAKDINMQVVHISLNAAVKKMEKFIPSLVIERFPEIRDRLKTALVSQIGPIGDMIMSGAIEKWTAGFQPTRQNLPALIDLIGSEIDEPAGRAQFLREAKKIIA